MDHLILLVLFFIGLFCWSVYVIHPIFWQTIFCNNSSMTMENRINVYLALIMLRPFINIGGVYPTVMVQFWYKLQMWGRIHYWVSLPQATLDQFFDFCYWKISIRAVKDYGSFCCSCQCSQCWMSARWQFFNLLRQLYSVNQIECFWLAVPFFTDVWNHAKFNSFTNTIMTL